MKSWSILAALALAGGLLASPAAAGNPLSTTDDATSFPYGESLIRPDLEGEPLAVPDGASIEGQVAAIEHDSGRLILDTHHGPVSLVAEPEQLVGIEVGDFVRVSFMDADDAIDAADADNTL